MWKKLALSPWTALITLIIVVTVRLADPAFVESVRLRYFDTLISAKAPTENNIITVDIDEAALDQYGQWPWPRSRYAEIIKDLYSRNAGVVVVNIAMSEHDRAGGDLVLANTLKQYPVILPSIPSDHNKNTPRVSGAAIIGAEYQDRIVQYPGLIANIPALENVAAGVGIVNTLPEVDGVNRRLPLIISVAGQLYPSLPMEALRVAAGDNTFQVKLNQTGVEKMRIPRFGAVSTDSLGRVWIDWSQHSQSYSITDLPRDLGGALVIVGPTAAGIANPVPTSVGAVYPHHAQAAVIGTMFNGVTIQRPDYADGVEILAMVTAGLLLLFLTRYTYVGLASVVVMVGGSVAVSHYMFVDSLWLFDCSAFAVGTVLVSLHAYGAKFVSEFLQKQQIKKQFGTYLSPALVEKLQKNPELLRLGGESRELTILFTDVRGFTTISEHYGKDVQGLTKIMNRYMTAMTAKILDNAGTLDKYIGDAQMAFWNAPLDDAEHARHAVATGLAMLGDLHAFNQEIAAEGVPPFGMGLGINTDTVVVGNMGSSQRFDYTCLGDGVNLASRLEGQSKPYHVQMVLGPKTAQAVRDHYFVLELDCLAVKGKKEGVNIFTVLATDASTMAEYHSAREHHDLALQCYRQQQWDMATRYFTELKTEFDGHMSDYYDMMLLRIQEYQHNPPGPDWDGVFRTTTK